MGMYNNVTGIDLNCECGQPLTGWQTKDGNNLCGMDVHYSQISNTYAICRNCGNWHEYSRRLNPLPESFTALFEESLNANTL